MKRRRKETKRIRKIDFLGYKINNRKILNSYFDLKHKLSNCRLLQIRQLLTVLFKEIRSNSANYSLLTTNNFTFIRYLTYLTNDSFV